jgi:hypothetical protein
MIRRFITLVFAVSSLALAQDRPPSDPAPDNKPATPPTQVAPADPAKPQVRKLDEFRYQIGNVTINQKTREIRFPTKVNMSEGLLEYLIVLQHGKIHEALLLTEISSLHLNLAFTLLRYPPSRELFSTIDETGHMTGLYPDVPAAVRAGARIALEVEWDDSGKTRRAPINEWLQNSVKGTPMPPGPWLYCGADFYEGKFIPEMTGDIASICIAPAALINYAGTDNQNDTVWVGAPKQIPPVGTPVTLIITPYSTTRTLPKP